MKVIDLSHTLNSEISIFPGAITPEFKRANTVLESGFAEYHITISSHHGTHIDAPYHIIDGSKTLDQFGPEKFIGPALKIDCRQLPTNTISLDVVKPYEPYLRETDFVILHTGWGSKWKNEDYCGDFPTLSKEAASWLAEFPLKGIGMDTISIDKVDSKDLPNHNIVLAKEILIIENMANLEELPERGFTLSCLPLKIEKADGSPVRAIGIIN